LSQKDPKRAGSRDISELKARLGLKKGAAGSGGKQNGAGVVPPPGLNLPPPPGAKPPGPVIPSAHDDPFGAMNAMAHYGAAQRAPEIVIVNDGKPVESVSTGEQAAKYGKLAAIGLAPLILGIVVGQIAKDAKMVNAGVDTAKAVEKLVDQDRKQLASLKTTFESTGSLRDRKVAGELTKALEAVKDDLGKNGLVVLKARMDYLGDTRGQVVGFYSSLRELDDMINDHVATAKYEEAAIKAGSEQSGKLTAKGDDALSQAGFPYKVAVVLSNPTDDDKNSDPQGAKLVELGAPLCGATIAAATPSTSGACGDGAPVGFLYRSGESQTGWNKGKLVVPGSLNAGEKFPIGELILPAPTGTLDALVKTSGGSVAEQAYFKRLKSIYDKLEAAYNQGDVLKGELHKKAVRGKRFTFFL